METKASQIAPHVHALIEGVHQDLAEKGIQGMRVQAIQFAPAGSPQCPPGTTWKCVDDPQTGGVHCGCF